MANIKEAFAGAVDTFTITNLNSLATSATAGWVSAAIDNTANLFLDYAIQLKLAAVNTAPANNKSIYLFVYSLLDASGSDYSTTGAASGGAPAGTEGTLTFPDITANPINLNPLRVIPYVGQNAIIITPWIPLLGALGGDHLPPKFGIAILNYSGMTIAASGNALKGLGTYKTVV